MELWLIRLTTGEKWYVDKDPNVATSLRRTPNGQRFVCRRAVLGSYTPTSDVNERMEKDARLILETPLAAGARKVKIDPKRIAYVEELGEEVR